MRLGLANGSKGLTGQRLQGPTVRQPRPCQAPVSGSRAEAGPQRAPLGANLRASSARGGATLRRAPGPQTPWEPEMNVHSDNFWPRRCAWSRQPRHACARETCAAPRACMQRFRAPSSPRCRMAPAACTIQSAIIASLSVMSWQNLRRAPPRPARRHNAPRAFPHAGSTTPPRAPALSHLALEPFSAGAGFEPFGVGAIFRGRRRAGGCARGGAREQTGFGHSGRGAAARGALREKLLEPLWGAKGKALGAIRRQDTKQKRAKQSVKRRAQSVKCKVAHQPRASTRARKSCGKGGHCALYKRGAQEVPAGHRQGGARRALGALVCFSFVLVRLQPARNPLSL